MNSFRAVVFSLNQTLLNHTGDLAPANRNIIHQLHEAGLLTGLASRLPLETLLKRLPLWEIESDVDFLIASNGDCFYDLHSKQKYYTERMDYKALRSVVKTLRAAGCTLGAVKNGRICFSRPSLWSLLYSLNRFEKPEYSLDSLKDRKVSSAVLAGAPSTLKKLHAGRKGQWHTERDGLFGLSVYDPLSSKYDGILTACSLYGLEPGMFLTFGCELCDLEMIQGTFGVAVKNAPAELCEAARQTTKYNSSQDGVAYHLNSMLLSDEFEFVPVMSEESGIQES